MQIMQLTFRYFLECWKWEGRTFLMGIYGTDFKLLSLKPFGVLKLKNTLVNLSSTEFTVFLIYNTRYLLFTNARIWDSADMFYFPESLGVVSSSRTDFSSVPIV